MNVDSKSNQTWGLLSQAYDKTTTNQTDISGYFNRDSSAIFNTQKTEKTQEIKDLFDFSDQTIRQLEEDSFTLSNDLKTLQKFAYNFSGTLENLGNAMAENGILSQEEKAGFDVLYRFNPQLDVGQTKTLLQNQNLTQESLKLLNQVNQKVGAVRYFGGF